MLFFPVMLLHLLHTILIKILANNICYKIAACEEIVTNFIFKRVHTFYLFQLKIRKRKVRSCPLYRLHKTKIPIHQTTSHVGRVTSTFYLFLCSQTSSIRSHKHFNRFSYTITIVTNGVSLFPTIIVCVLVILYKYFSKKFYPIAANIRWPMLLEEIGTESEATNFPWFWLSRIALESFPSRFLVDIIGLAFTTCLLVFFKCSL